MTALVITPIVTIIFLLKLLFSDLNGGSTVKENIKQGVMDAKDIHDSITDILNEDVKQEKQTVKNCL